ncbi:MAG: hypothetical protein PHI34_06825 [Acidobacteriota bacterium]|nr:hypothetical protein [Acidobacteriota bacterium]
MARTILRFAALAGFGLWAAARPFPLTLTTDELRCRIDDRGAVTSLYDLVHGRELLAPGQPAPLLSIKAGAGLEAPAAASEIEPGLLRLAFPASGAEVDVRVSARPTHLVFEVVRAEPAAKIRLCLWGPFPTSIGQTVGEIVGVVRDGTYGLGLQALNPKTIGSYPDNEEGFDMSRGRAAEPRTWGSVLQAYSLNRSLPRTADVWLGQFPGMPIEPIPGETVVGSKIALFGCPEPAILDRLGAIEIAERLPHPMIDGVWAKVSPERGRSYLIVDFGEETIDELLGYTRRGGFMSLYHMEPFESWGHFEISRKWFPNGAAGLRACVAKAKALGIRLGAHTLTSFIQTNDSYVTPVPDHHLARTGTSALTADIGPAATEIPVASPEFFNNEKANWLHTVVVGNELVRYRAVSDAAPWRLLDCQRGAFGTRAAAHARGAEAGKLLDHPYKVFFPNFELQREIARGLARRFNETGLSQMDFDGHEGCASTGQGDYAYELFPVDFFNGLDHAVINGTSNSKHFYWHINSYCNWGEPWYEGFRESMQEYRIKNQALFERNYIPNMLGWYLMRDTTSLSDVEWMLARAAGYGAGFAFTSSLEDMRKNPETGAVLDAIREWETARRGGAFSPEQRLRMKNPKAEFHLAKRADGGWDLYPFHESQAFSHEKMSLQPGQPTAAEWTFDNPDDAQPLQLKLKAAGREGSLRRPRFEIDGYFELVFDVEMQAGQTLLWEGAGDARLYDDKGQPIKTVAAPAAPPTIGPGSHRIVFDAEFRGDAAPKAEATFRTRGRPERILPR